MAHWIVNKLCELYCKRRLNGAYMDREYWLSEVERTQINAGVAQTRIEVWRERLADAHYPVRGPRGWRRGPLASYLPPRMPTQ